MSQSGMANIKMSLDRHIHDNISGVSVDYEGVPFSNLEANKWIQPRVMDVSSNFHRQSNSSGTSYGETANIFFNINCFVKKGTTRKAHEHYILRDTVAEQFTIGKDITIRDYVGNGSSIASMRVRSIVTDRPLMETNKHLGYAFAVELDYTRQTTKP